MLGINIFKGIEVMDQGLGTLTCEAKVTMLNLPIRAKVHESL